MLHSGPVIASRDGLTVIDCRECGWAHLDPFPAVDDEYYKSEFWQTTKAGWLAKYEAQRDWLDMRHGDWLSVVEEHTEKSAWLDVGSGYGFLLHEVIVNSWKAYGIEPSQDAAEYSDHHAGQEIFYGTWHDFGSKGRFNCISALWLMEHLPDPMAFLRWCKAHLALGGVLLLAVPQEFTALQEQANEIAKVHDWIVHPTHVNYWTAATFYNLLGRAGFRVVDALASWPMEQHILNGRDYTDDEEKGNEAHRIVRNFELTETREFRLRFSRDRARQARGRDLIVYCKADA